MWTTLAMTAMLTLSTPAEAKQYANSPGGFMITTNCVGCPKGDKATLNPAVYQYLLSQQESVVRAHYDAYSTFIVLPEEQKGGLNKAMAGLAWGDLNWIYGNQTDFINAQTGTNEVGPALAADEDGTIFARAVAMQTADAANEMLAKKGLVTYMWGMHWTNGADEGAPVEPKVPMVFGIQMSLFTVDVDTKTVTMHVWGKGMVTTVRKTVATIDLSGVPGAFDAGASLTYEDVAAKAVHNAGDLTVVYDEALGAAIVGLR